MKCYKAGYPRPQFVRNDQSWENLNGSWDFAYDDKNEGIEKKWYSSFPQCTTIMVPFAYECPASGIGDTSRHDFVWYKKQIYIDSKKKSDSKIFIHFEGSDYNTRLWVNGKFAGTHNGGYARFSLDITKLAKSGKNTIVVRVEDSFDISQPRGKQRWMEDNFGCWYIQTTGIWKTVWIEYVNEIHIKSVKMTPVLSTGQLEIEAEINAKSDEDLELEVLIFLKNMPVNIISAPVKDNNCEITADIFQVSAMDSESQLWSPEHPNLYDISYTLKRKNKILDEVLSYFGMREIRIEGNKILLNGKPLYQRLLLDQGYWKDSHLTPPSEQALITDIEKIMSAGYNGVRKHQKTEDERFFYWADVKGLLVWGEMAAAYEFNDYVATNFTTEWMEIVKQFYNHPSIIIWTPFNESWGIEKVKTDREQQNFTESIYNMTKAYDKQRPIITNDGWEHTISDIITLHDYDEKGEGFIHRYEKHIKNIMGNELYHNFFKSVFSDGYSYHGQPIFLSEFGGIAFTFQEEGWGYGSKVSSKEEYIRRFEEITTTVKSINAFCGYCYTQSVDIQQEVNGIMDIERNFKVDPEILKEINEREVKKQEIQKEENMEVTNILDNPDCR